MRSVFLTAILLPILFATELHSQEVEHPIDVALDECLSIDSNQSTYGMIQCSMIAYDAWDAELNRVYKELMGTLDSAGQDALRAAQQAWLTYRDAEIELCGAIYYGNLEGTMYHIIAADRVMDMVRKRALELGAYLDNLSGQ